MKPFCDKLQCDSNENLNGNLEKLYRTDEFLTLEQLLKIYFYTVSTKYIYVFFLII